MRSVRDFFKDGVAHSKNSCILNFTSYETELIQLECREPLIADIGKNPKNIKKNSKYEFIENNEYKSGNFFYLWCKPLYNYYHTINDSLGCIYYYFKIKETKPNLKFLINRDPKPPLKNYPPYVFELNLLDIEFEFTSENYIYENLYFGDNLNSDINGQRAKHKKEYFFILNKLVNSALNRKLDIPIYDNIYLSRRVKANTKYNKKILGEDNTLDRELVNEDEVVEIAAKEGFREIFGENYTLAEKIIMFNKMKKYISHAGAGVTNNF